MSQSWFELLAILVAEFRRANAAARRYETLKHGSPAARAADLPRQVFDACYGPAAQPELPAASSDAPVAPWRARRHAAPARSNHWPRAGGAA
jgi:hypothetical protein